VKAEPADSNDLSTLLEGIVVGDQAAWQHTVQRFTGLLRSVCRRHRLSPDQSADVAQMTWLRLLTHAHQIRDPRGLSGWLATTATRECLSLIRLERREIPVERVDAVPAEEFDVDGRIDAEARAQELRLAVRRLGGRERAVVELLLESEQPPYADISRRLDMPIGAIGPVRQRALHRLYRQLVTARSEPEADAVA
jgi:RNA polymerase sigma factor (sigma-70 family)